MDYKFLGVNLGSFKSSVCLFDKNNHTVVLNQASERDTPSSVTFNQDSRCFGEASALTAKTKSAWTVESPTRFIGLDSAQREEIQSAYSLAVFDNHKFVIRDSEMDPQVALTSFISYLFQLAKVDRTQTAALNCFAVPNNSSHKYRKALRACIAAACLYTPVLISEKIAIGLDYISSLVSNKAHTNPHQKKIVLFIDFGHSKLSTFALRLSDTLLEEVTDVTDIDIGVRVLDQLFLEKLKVLAEAQTRVPLNSKKLMRLKEIVKKTRTILSANNEHTIHEELGDQDLQLRITRPQFEEMCRPLFKRITLHLNNLKACIQACKIPISQIYEIEIMGGGSRIPEFRRIVSEVFSEAKVKATITSSQCIARGCGLYIHRSVLKHQSRMSLVTIKEIAHREIRVYVNYFNKKNEQVGKDFVQNKTSNTQKHVVFRQGGFLEDKALQLDLKSRELAFTGIEFWLISVSLTQKPVLIEYYMIQKSKLGNEANHYLVVDISTREGYPRIASCRGIDYEGKHVKELSLVLGQNTEQAEQIRRLRKIEEQYLKRDQESHSVILKKNQVEKLLYGLQDQKERSEIQDRYRKANTVQELDALLQEISAPKPPS